MKTIKRVMACVDFSDYTLETIESALAMTKKQQTDIVIFNVIDSKDVDVVENISHNFPEMISPENYIKGVETERRRLLEKMIMDHFEGHRARLKILFHVGIPYDAILHAIESEKIDIVVIASKGRSNLIGTLHGSTAEKVFRHATVPVLSARNREKFSRHQ